MLNSEQCRLAAELRPSQPTWAVNVPVCCYCLSQASTIHIAHSKS